MGNASLPTQFSQREIQRLYHRFKQLDDDDSGDLDLDQVLKISQLANNPIVKRVMEIFDKNKDGKISFIEFVTGLSCLYGSDDQTKSKFAFQIYDIDEDGFITSEQLFKVLKMMVGGNVTDHQLQSLVKRTICQADLDGDGKISYPEFKLLIKDFNVKEKLKIAKI